jgi:hypothetical protein
MLAWRLAQGDDDRLMAQVTNSVTNQIFQKTRRMVKTMQRYPHIS